MVIKDKRKPDNQERPYKLSDVKRCFPLASDALIGRWIEKGYVSHGVKARGSLRLFTFNVSEIVHIGVLMQASAFGVTQSTSGMRVDVVPPPSDSPVSKHYYMTNFLEPEKLANLYQAVDYNIVYFIRSKEKDVKQTPGRNKRGWREYYGILAVPWMMSLFIGKEIDKKDSKFTGTGGTLIIHVGGIADTVGSRLGIGELWVSKDIMV